MSSAGMSLIHGIILESNVREFIKLNVNKDDFGVNESDIFEYIQSHVNSYGQVPAAVTVQAQFGIDVKPVAEPLGYYEDIVKKKSLQKSLKKTLMEASSLLQDMKPEDALAKVVESSLALSMKKYGNKLMDFRDANKVIPDLYWQEARSPDSSGLKFGWDYLDSMTGGIRGGDMLSIIGRPCTGKTFLLLFIAMNAWVKHKTPIMFVSMEMKPEVIFQRLTALYISRPLTKLVCADFNTADFAYLLSSLAGIEEQDMPPFYIIDGNLSATVADINILARQLKPSAVFIDGAYLVRHTDTRLNKYARIEANCESFKNILATDLDIPVCLSYQFNREAIKSRGGAKDSQAGLEHIAGSDAIGQLSSVVLGLMQEDNIETLKTRLISVLKGRNGEVGDFRINWDFVAMDFKEFSDNNKSDLDII